MSRPGRWGRRAVVSVVAVAAALTAAPATAALAVPATASAGVTVGGDVQAPASYTRAALAALPQTTLPVTALGARGHTVTGVDLESLVLAARPTLDPTVKNGILRVRATVTGAGGSSVTTALGELDPGFGHHPALLVLAVDGRPLPTVAFGFPGDLTAVRAVADVRRVTVAVATVPDPLPVANGALVVSDGARTVTLGARTLQRLPRTTTTVTYTAGGVSETHAESGPQLAFVLLVAGIVPTRSAAVTAVGADGYLATVTPAESISGARTLLLSLVEDGHPLAAPRLVAGGDLKGGRYVSGVVELVVTR